MTKKSFTDEEDDFDYSNIAHASYDEEVMASVMKGLIQASIHKMTLALELTKLALEKTPAKERDEEEVLLLFEKSSQIIAKKFPLKTLWDKFLEKY
jgi:hypothetical protein